MSDVRAGSAPPAATVAHRAKGYELRKPGGGFWYVWECVCGASGPLHTNVIDANNSYRRHKHGPTTAESLLVPFDEPSARG